MSKKLIILTDCGDTIIDEGSEFRAPGSEIVLRADCIPGAKETMLELHRRGHSIALVADGLIESFHNILGQNELLPIFSAEVISETYGVNKPDAVMFAEAFRKLGLTDADKHRVIMVGNNISRDIVGANRFGILSVLLTWSPRYCMEPQNAEETPDYCVAVPEELLMLVEKLENTL